MSARITITLPEDLLDELDARADREGVSRSFVVREAAARYVTADADEIAIQRRRASVDRTLSLIDELQSLPLLDGRPTLEILREIRGPLGEDDAR